MQIDTARREEQIAAQARQCDRRCPQPNRRIVRRVITPEPISLPIPMTEKGHQGKASPAVLSARSRLGEQTFAGPHNGQDALRKVILTTAIDTVGV